MKTCTNCNYIQGDECILYQGPDNAACGLSTGQWYKIGELLIALNCTIISLGNLSPTEPSVGCTGCICLYIDGENNYNSSRGNFNPVLNYALFLDLQKTQSLVSRNLSKGEQNTFYIVGPLGFDKLYLDLSVTLSPIDPDSTYYTIGNTVNVIVIAGGIIQYARSLEPPIVGDHFFSDMPVLPVGIVKVLMITNEMDTNNDVGQGVIAIGGEKLTSSPLMIDVTMEEGGMANPNPVTWPTFNADDDYVYINFDTDNYSQHATGMSIGLTITNNEHVALKIEFIASLTSSLFFTDQLAVGIQYQKSVELTRDQATDNDFIIRVTKDIP